MTVTEINTVQTLLGRLGMQNFLTTAPYPLIEEDIPILYEGGVLLEAHPSHENPLPAHHAHLLEKRPDFALIISTGSAYRIPVLARTLIAQLNAMRPINRQQGWLMETALHELITNAINHGNLAAHSILQSQRDDIGALAELLSEKIQDSKFAHRYLTCTLQIQPTQIVWTIADDGAGFDASSVVEKILQDPLRYTGRGILMARKSASGLSFNANGRIAEVSFAL